MADALTQRDVDQLRDFLARMCHEVVGATEPIDVDWQPSSDPRADPHRLRVQVRRRLVGRLIGEGGHVVKAMQAMVTVSARARGCGDRFRVVVDGRGGRDGG